MTNLMKTIPLAMTAVMLVTSVPQIAAAGHDQGRKRYQAREQRHDDRGRERYRKHREYRPVERHRGGKVVVHERREKRVVVHKYRHKHKRSANPWPWIAVLGVTAAYLHANTANAEPAVRYIEPQPVPVPPTPVAAQPQPLPQGPAASCLMTREYQTQIVVNGRLVDGYGQACLQPDGSWYRGPAVAVAY